MADIGKKLESFDQDPYILSNSSEPLRQQDRNASLDDITTYIYQSLIDFQGKWYTTNRGSSVINMPNARYLAVGDKITNATTAKTYLISEVVGERSRTVRLNLQGSTAPAEGDILVLEDRNTINFVSAYSREYQDRPIAEWRDTVVFRVKRREPGTIGKHPFDPPTEIKPRTRQYIVDPDHTDSHIWIQGQWYDNLIQFDCWSKYNNSADSLVDWFEDFMYKYTWVWKKNGVNEILYWMRTEDHEVSKWRNDLAVRTVVYYFRTEKIVTIKEHDFRQIDLFIGLAKNLTHQDFSSTKFGNILPASGYTEILDLGSGNYDLIN